MGRHGFSIDLDPSFRLAVAAADLSQVKIERLIEGFGRRWLDCCGFDDIYDPSNCGHRMNIDAEPGPLAHPMYKPNTDLRVDWGSWGPELIRVPGNACELGIQCNSFGCVFKGGATLHSHDVHTWRQKYLLLIVFTYIADTVILLSQHEEIPERVEP